MPFSRILSSIIQKTLEFDFTNAPDSLLFNADLAASYDRMCDAECDEDCNMMCSVTVSERNRQEAYDKFRAVPETRVAQNLYLLCTYIELNQRSVDTEDHIIEQTIEFWLGDEIKIKVCKTFFARTLGLPNVRLDALLEPETFEWFSKYKSLANDDYYVDDDRPSYSTGQPCTDFVLNSRKHLEKNSWAFVEETDSDVDISLDDISSSVYNNVINHIQTTPRVVTTWKNQENHHESFNFECSVNCHYMYMNYLKSVQRKSKKKINEKQYKKIYNRYIKKHFMI